MSLDSTIKKVRNTVDSAVLSTLANNLWMLVRGPVSLLMIPLFLSDVNQGYWFTFGSLAALCTFADLGFTAIVGQFSAHEYAHLRINSEGMLEGNKYYLERIISLFRFVLKWIATVAGIAIPVIAVIGVLVLNSQGNMSEWLLPWLLYIIGSGLNFGMGAILSFFAGCDQIAKIQRNYLIGSITITVATWILLALNFNLYTLAITSIFGAVVNLGLLIINFKNILVQMLKTKLTHQFNWRNDFMNLIWKYALSWIAGYFIFQIFTPLAFMVFDPIQAGRVGITLTLIKTFFTIASVWIDVMVPKINMSVAKHQWKIMGRQLYKGTIMSIVTFTVGAVVMLGGYAMLVGHIAILDRFLGIAPMTMLLSAFFLQIIINSIAIYGRSHKIEPFVIPSLIGAAVSISITLMAVFTLGINFIFMGIMVSSIVGIVMFIVIFLKRKTTWNLDYEKKHPILDLKEPIKK